ncbi:uncharacterized protein LOC143910636 [Arctopsyche grandis]|uniref:uncharacterized protein LOC143910636 n=1 Tax=Arctopsyche grandis TaxID=121162 RepID=UPI00406D69D1
MECRLCLRFASTISIYDNPHQLVQRIWTCCQLQVREGDSLPDMICLSCVNNLELLNGFRNVCLQSDKTSKQRLDGRLDIKTEEVILENLVWEDESSANPPQNIDDSTVNNELESSALEQSGSKPNVQIMDNTNSPMRGGKVICDEKAEMIDIEIPPEEPLLSTISYKTCSIRPESDHIINFQDMSDSNRATFKCKICLKPFTAKSTLAIHEKSHTGKKPHKCEICLKLFTKKFNLIRHFMCHTGEKSYKCDICLKPFAVKSNLVIHLRSHAGVKPHKCEICSKSFTVKSNLVTHMKYHTWEKPHKCDVCLMSFTAKSSLLKHERSHTGKKPYKCRVAKRPN